MDEDFFKSMKISLGDAGKNVLNTMSTDFTEEELSGIYSSEEIDIIMGKTNIEKPVASNAAISGSGETTTQMTATADGDENTASFNVVWEMSQTSAESGFSKVGEGETNDYNSFMGCGWHPVGFPGSRKGSYPKLI